MKLTKICYENNNAVFIIVQCSLEEVINLTMVSGTMFLLCWVAIFKKDGFKAKMRVRDGGRGRENTSGDYSVVVVRNGNVISMFGYAIIHDFLY